MNLTKGCEIRPYTEDCRGRVTILTFKFNKELNFTGSTTLSKITHVKGHFKQAKFVMCGYFKHKKAVVKIVSPSSEA